MKGKFLSGALCVALCAGLLPVFGAPVLLQGSLTQSRVSDLTSEIDWHTSLAQAEQVAGREGKLVFWVHMLGDMKGAT